MNLRAMAMKGYCTFPKAPALLKPHHQIVCVISGHSLEGILPLCRYAVSVFYSPADWADLQGVDNQMTNTMTSHIYLYKSRERTSGREIY